MSLTPQAKCLGRIPVGDRWSHCRCWLDIEWHQGEPPTDSDRADQ